MKDVPDRRCGRSSSGPGPAWPGCPATHAQWAALGTVTTRVTTSWMRERCRADPHQHDETPPVNQPGIGDVNTEGCEHLVSRDEAGNEQGKNQRSHDEVKDNQHPDHDPR